MFLTNTNNVAHYDWGDTVVCELTIIHRHCLFDIISKTVNHISKETCSTKDINISDTLWNYSLGIEPITVDSSVFFQLSYRNFYRSKTMSGKLIYPSPHTLPSFNTAV